MIPPATGRGGRSRAPSRTPSASSTAWSTPPRSATARGCGGVGRADPAGGGTGSEGGPVDAGEPLGTSGAVSLDQTLLGTGFGYLPRVRRRQARVLLEVLPAVRDIRRAGSAALDLCAVAAGRLDAYYERGVNPWDYAAGWLVVTEAGGVVSGVGASEPGANGIVAAAPAVHAAVRDLVETVTAGVPDDETPGAGGGR